MGWRRGSQALLRP